MTTTTPLLSQPADPQIQREGRMLTILSMMDHRGYLALDQGELAQIADSAISRLNLSQLENLRRRLATRIEQAVKAAEARSRTLEQGAE